MRRAAPALILLAALAGCAGGAAPPGDATTGEAAREAPSAGEAASLPAPSEGHAAALPEPSPDKPEPERRAGLARPRADAPRIYMALQEDSAGTVSLVFAIDQSRDGTPGDDPAIRITPEDGACNPQEMRRYAFAGDARPVFGPAEARRGIGPERLPAFMAVAATDAMLATGRARTREETRAQNICTRKLWERLVTARSGQ